MTERANLAKSSSEYTKAYSNPRGVDFSEIGSDSSRFAYLENMYVDYESGGDAVETIPGFRILYNYGSKINAIHFQNLGEGEKYVLVHSGDGLYRFNINDRDYLENQEAIATLENRRSHSFTLGEKLYVLDGKSMIRIDGNGTANIVSDDGEAPPYVPTIYEDGAKKEDKNLLTDKYAQRFHISNTDKYAYSTKGLTFAVNDYANKRCSVTGGKNEIKGDLFIPSTAVIDGVEYTVTEIAPSAFLGFKSITSVNGGSNLERIGQYAFKDCTNLKYAIFKNGLKEIDYSAFCNSPSFEEIYVGLGFKEFASDAIINCGTPILHYAGDEKSAEEIVGFDLFKASDVRYLSQPTSIRLGFPIMGSVSTVDNVKIGDISVEFNYDEELKEVVVSHDNGLTLVGEEVAIYGTLESGDLSSEAIFGCTVICAHDGRIFLSGNSKFPGYVFHTRGEISGELFFAESDCFVDGVSDYPVKALLSAHGTLAVFKSQDDGSGSIFCHTSSETNGRVTYPVTYTHGGISGSVSSYVISDDAVFLSEGGLFALEKVAGSGYKELSCRSSNVNRKLLREKLSKITITEWCGYLVLCAGERFYLADCRDKFKKNDSFEYEWYFLNGIGTYKKGSRIYRYSALPGKICYAHPTATDEISEGTVMSEIIDEFPIYYVYNEYGDRYHVYPTEEFTGGKFSPACFALGIDKLLFFGTESGDLCVFNNDKRGKAPDYMAYDKDFDEEEYAATMGDKIHSYFYTFADRPIKCSLKTASDDCSVPHLAKSTVKRSLVVKCKNFTQGGFSAEVTTDHGVPYYLGNYSASRFLFNDLSFSSINFSTAAYSVIPIPESERGWVEKQLSFSSESFRSPFGICSVTYRYKIKGRIKYE